jgi:competence protein ComEC
MIIQKPGQNPFLKQTPFLRFLIPLLAGIITEKNIPFYPGLLIPVFCLSILLLIFYTAISYSKFRGTEWIPGFAIQIAFFFFGTMLVYIHRDISVVQSAPYSKNRSHCLLIELLSDPVPKQYSFKSVARVIWLLKDQTCYYENEKILVYFSKNTDASELTAGSQIILRKELQPIENFQASGFDYKNYCQLRHIYAQVFLKEDEYVRLDRKKEKSVLSTLDSLRKKLLIIIKKQLPAKSDYSLMEALLVGYTDDLDPGLLKSYADTGVIHIIAISGLHLALICHILQLALQKVGGRNSGQWIKFVLIVISLWGYSLLSGASPSVIRAATMFTLILFARNILRETVIYNTLAASAFLLVCFDPYWIWDTGFQLSYAAVLSLCLFSKPIRNLLPLQNKILSAIWDGASVSIAAQILTTPISIYYFHRFPSYFLVANLLAVPLSSGILLGGIFLSLFSRIRMAGLFLGWILGVLIRFLNKFINHISQWPGAVISGLGLTLTQLILLYFMILCIYRFWVLKEKSWMLMVLGSICLFQLIVFFR